MPKNPVADPITDQEIAFAQLILSGTVTDRQAAETAGLNPDTAAYTKAKPRVQAWMLKRRTAMEEQRAQQEAEGQRRQQMSREQVLARLWDIANLNPEATRNSASAQIKALSMIIAIEGLIPDRRAAQQKPATPPVTADFYKAEWLREQQERQSQPGPASVRQSLRQKEEPLIPPPGASPEAAADPDPTSNPAPASLESNSTRPLSPAETPSWVPEAFISPTALDLSVPFSIKKNPFARW